MKPEDKDYNAGDKFTMQYMELGQPACYTCKHRHPTDVTRCLAFTQEIPEEIMFGDNDHTEPFEGDGGIRYEKKE